MLNYIDFEWGGFQGSPKFPQFYVFESFLHFYKKNKNKNFMMLLKFYLIMFVQEDYMTTCLEE